MLYYRDTCTRDAYLGGISFPGQLTLHPKKFIKGAGYPRVAWGRIRRTSRERQDHQFGGGPVLLAAIKERCWQFSATMSSMPSVQGTYSKHGLIHAIANSGSTLGGRVHGFCFGTPKNSKRS